MREWEESLEKELQEVRKVYVEALVERKKQLQEAVEEYRASPGMPELIKNLKTIIHRLRGSAGSFGFQGISFAAESLEDWLDKVDLPSLKDEKQTLEFNALVQRLSDEMDNPELDK